MRTLTLLIIALSITGLCRAQHPVLWGMTSSGGQFGTIFNINTANDSETVVYDFAGNPDGEGPTGSLIKASSGLLYGMTLGGGTYYGGTIFSYNLTSGVETVLHSFNGSDTDGFGPYGSLLLATNGLLYGMAQGGGAYGDGVLFSYNIENGVFTDLHDFSDLGNDGTSPTGSLIQLNDTMLYGMTNLGSHNNEGIIFSYNISSGTETPLWTFGNDTDGATPYGSLLQANNGLLYGMTQYGGTSDSGVIFSFNIATDSEVVVHNFAGGSDGSYPAGSLTQASDSLLYGMTEYGGGYDGGTIFSFNTSTGAENVLWNLGSDSDGLEPQGSLIQASNGLLYGMTLLGGPNASLGGIVLSYNIAKGKENDLYNFGSKPNDGTLPYGDLLEDDDIPQPMDIECSDRDQHSLYLLASGNFLYRMDSVDTNPDLVPLINTNYSADFSGISINKNLDDTIGEITMYVVDSLGEYYYWNDSDWIDTHHQSGNLTAVNPGGTNNYIFNVDGETAKVYRYDGTGNGTLLTTLPVRSNVLSYDVATDMDGNFYLYLNTGIIRYNPDGIPMDTFFVKGNVISGGGGFGLVGSDFYITNGNTPYQSLWRGTVNGNSVTFSTVYTFPSTVSQIYDMANCYQNANIISAVKTPEVVPFTIYPNPASDFVLIKMENTASIDLFNSLGQQLFSANTSGLTQYKLMLAGFTPGLYFVTGTSGNGLVEHTTLVVQ